MKPFQNVGFLGLGKMGGAMAERLLGADFRLHVFDPHDPAMYRFIQSGAVAHNSPMSVANSASIVFACLPNQEVSRQAAFGPDGVVHGSEIRIYAEMSTIGKDAIEQIASTLIEKGIETVDAPITGGLPGARAGTLAMLVSGSPSSIETIDPLLRVIGKDVYCMGDHPGMAQVMKLINNLVMASNVIVASEGLVFGAKARLDADMMMKVLNAGTGASFASSAILKNAISGLFNFGAALSIIEKDLNVGLSEASLVGVEMPVIDKARTIWHAAYEAGRGADDFTTILQAVEEKSGIRVRGRPA